jgi:hypothetical protein
MRKSWKRLTSSPALKKAGGPAADYVDILIAQNRRGREITDYVLAVTSKGAIGSGDAEPLANALDNLELMYENHAAREDTIVFPAWKDALSAPPLDDMGGGCRNSHSVKVGFIDPFLTFDHVAVLKSRHSQLNPVSPALTKLSIDLCVCERNSESHCAVYDLIHCHSLLLCSPVFTALADALVSRCKETR